MHHVESLVSMCGHLAQITEKTKLIVEEKPQGTKTETQSVAYLNIEFPLKKTGTTSRTLLM